MKTGAWMAAILGVTAVVASPSGRPVGLAALSAKEAAAIERTLAGWDQDEHRDLGSIIVRRHGVVVAERYYNSVRPETLHDVRSAGKSVTSLLIGAALDRGSIRQISDPVRAYVAEAEGKPAGVISIENLLTMRSGLSADDRDPSSPGNENKLDESPDTLAFALGVPMSGVPGRRYIYNSLTAFLAGIVLERAVGRGLEEFAREVLFQPLRITDWRWNKDVSGHTKGQGNLFLTARDFAKIGQMVLDQGVYEGRRIVSASWVSESLKPRVSIGAVDPYADGYGHFWYTKTHRIHGRDVRVSFASGNGGNKIYLVPSHGLVVAITSSAYGQSHGQRRSEAILKHLLATMLKESRIPDSPRVVRPDSPNPSLGIQAYPH